MKKNKVLYRCYVGGYFLWLFGALLAPLLCIRFSNAFAIVMLVLAILALAGLITSHVFYNKKREWFVPASFAAHGLNAGLILFAFIVEMTFVAQGNLGLYAVIISSICTGFYILAYSYLVIANRALAKKMAEKKKKIEEEKARLENLASEEEKE